MLSSYVISQLPFKGYGDFIDAIRLIRQVKNDIEYENCTETYDLNYVLRFLPNTLCEI